MRGIICAAEFDVGAVLSGAQLVEFGVRLVLDLVELVERGDIGVLDRAQVLGEVDEVGKRVGAQQQADGPAVRGMYFVQVARCGRGALLTRGQQVLLDVQDLVGDARQLSVGVLRLGGRLLVRRGGPGNLALRTVELRQFWPVCGLKVGDNPLSF